MKYAIIIPDGCADEPQPQLGDRTPLQAANTPHMDALAASGTVGLADNVPPQLTAASDVATLSLFGYDPLECYTGRAPLEVAAMGIPMGPQDWAIRCNLVTIADGKMADFTAGHISSEEASSLVDALNEAFAECRDGRMRFHAGVSYRNILLYHGDEHGPFSVETKTQPPHDIPDQPIERHLPQGPGAELLREFMDRSRQVFAEHEVNIRRQAEGKKPVTQIWLWGQGKAPKLTPFETKYGKRGAIISAVDLVRGVGVLIGWKRIDVAGATGYLDTDYAAKGRAAVAALDEVDLVCVHIEAPDEASHEGRADAKVAAIEEIDRHIVGPVAERLRGYPQWRMLVEPDHRTLLRTKAHAHGEVPLVVAGTGVVPAGQASYDEESAARSSLRFTPGHRLMAWFLGQEANP